MSRQVKISNSTGGQYASANSANRYVMNGKARWLVPGKLIELTLPAPVHNSTRLPVRPSSKMASRAWGSSSMFAAQPAAQAKRQSLKDGAVGSHTPDEWRRIVMKSGNKCLRCSASGWQVKLTKDHVCPLSEGGTDYASNLQPLCGPCNSWKGSREIDFRSHVCVPATA